MISRRDFLKAAGVAGLSFLLCACQAVTLLTPGVTPQPTPEQTKVPPPTPAPEPTATPTIEVSQEDELKQALADWLSGKTEIPSEELLLEPISGKRLPLGTLGEEDLDPNTEQFADYQGVLLGTKEVDGQLILMIGFETAYGTRYTLPFNAGPVENGLLVQVVQQPRFVEGWGPNVVTELIPVPELAQKLRRISGKPIRFMSFFSLAGFPEDQVDEKVKQQLFPTFPTSQEVYDFVHKATQGELPTPPPARVEPLLNIIPKPGAQVHTFPSVVYIEQAGDWVTAP